MPPPSLLTSTTVSRQAVQPRRDERAEVVQERDVAEHQHDRPDRPPPPPEGGRDDAVDAVGAAVGEDRDGALAAGQPAVEVAHRHRAARPTAARRRAATRASDRERRALERLVERGQPGRSSPRSPRRRRGQPVAPAHGAGRPAAARPSALGEGAGASAPASACDERRREQRGLAPAAVAVDDDELRPRGREQLGDGLRGRHGPEADDQLRPMRVDPRPGPDELIATDEDDRRSWRPARSPDSASARMGKPVAAAECGRWRRAAPGRRPGRPR